MDLELLATGLGAPEIVVIVVLAIVIFFGIRRLPELGRNLGQGIRAFRGAMKEADEPPDDRQDKPKPPDEQS